MCIEVFVPSFAKLLVYIYRDLTRMLDIDHELHFSAEDRTGMISDILTLAMVKKDSIPDAFRMIRLVQC